MVTAGGDDDGKSSKASRDHYICQDENSKIWTIAGGKWTTFREMAEDLVDHLCEAKEERSHLKSGTRDVLFIGEGPVEEFPKGWHKNLGIHLSGEFNIPHDVAEHLSHAYGTRSFEFLKEARKEELTRLHPEFPILEAEIRYAVRKEFAQTATDVLARRTRIAFLNIEACNASIQRVCDILGDELKWNKSRIKEEVEKTKERFAREFGGPKN